MLNDHIITFIVCKILFEFLVFVYILSNIDLFVNLLYRIHFQLTMTVYLTTTISATLLYSNLLPEAVVGN